MTRSLVLIPILLAACSVGEYGESTIGTDGSMMGGDDRNLCVDKVAAPPAAYVHVSAPADDRKGMGCIAAGCHLEGQLGAGATAFAFAGTVYKDLAGTIPQPGATVRIFPGTGNTMKSLVSAVSDSAGNFIIRGAYADFPYQTDVTACGTDAQAQGIRPMAGAIGRGDNNCSNAGTCHQATPAVVATPVYLMD